MTGSGNSGGPGGGLSGANKIAMLLAGGTVAGLITWFIWPGGGGSGDDTEPRPVFTVVNESEPQSGGLISGPTMAPASAPPQPAGVDRKALTEGYPEGVLLTITAFGLPARVGATFENEDDVITSGMFMRDVNKACNPDELYPDPCISYWLVKSGTTVTVTAGDARAGWWPSLEAVRGPGCDLTGDGRELSCTLTLAADVELVATYYGGENPGLAHYTYPVCPLNREGPPAPPAWAARCR